MLCAWSFALWKRTSPRGAYGHFLHFHHASRKFIRKYVSKPYCNFLLVYYIAFYIEFITKHYDYCWHVIMSSKTTFFFSISPQQNFRTPFPQGFWTSLFGMKPIYIGKLWKWLIMFRDEIQYNLSKPNRAFWIDFESNFLKKILWVEKKLDPSHRRNRKKPVKNG